MQYKTIVHELIQEQPDLLAKLTSSNSLLSTINQLAKELRENHLSTVEHLLPARPGTSELQVRSEAMETAVHELRNLLRMQIPANDSSPMSLDDAIAFIQRRSPQS